MKLELTTTVAVLTIIIMLRERCCTNRYGTDSLLQALLPAGVTVKDFVYGFTYKKSHTITVVISDTFSRGTFCMGRRSFPKER